jgi:hypothetical protein
MNWLATTGLILNIVLMSDVAGLPAQSMIPTGFQFERSRCSFRVNPLGNFIARRRSGQIVTAASAQLSRLRLASVRIRHEIATGKPTSRHYGRS